MARAAVKAKQAERAKAQPAKAAVRRGRRKHSGGGNPNQQLFFSRLRRRAKIAYVILAVLFAVTFAFLGVGSGSSGLDQLFSGINIFGGGGSSVSKALKEAQKHPTDPKSFRDLATAYEAKGDTANSISALQQYTNLKPKDAKAWNELAGLELVQAQNLTTQYQDAYAAEQLAAPSAAFLPTGKLGTALGTDPIEQAAATTANAIVSDIGQQIGLAYNAEVSAYQQVVKLQPNDSNAQFQLAQAAQTAGQNAIAVKAYKAYLKLNPTSSSAAQIKALIKQLSPAPAKPAKKPAKKAAKKTK
jgi:tetratricopeptide (TPR) repeat protein